MTQRRYIIKGYHEYDPRQEAAEQGIDVPEHWEIWNAARPLYGHVNWRGTFLSGVFYVAIDPEGDYADEYRERTQRLDGYLITYLDYERDVVPWARRYCQEHGVDYAEFEGEREMLVRSFFAHREEEEHE